MTFAALRIYLSGRNSRKIREGVIPRLDTTLIIRPANRNLSQVNTFDKSPTIEYFNEGPDQALQILVSCMTERVPLPDILDVR